MLKDLQAASETISLEAQEPDTTPQATSKLLSLMERAGEFLTKTIGATVGNFFQIKDLGWLAVNASRKPYSDLRGIQLAAPQGFKGSLADYGEVLYKAAEASDVLLKDILNPFAVWLAGRLSDQESLRALTNTLKIPGFKDFKPEQWEKQLDHFFPKKTDPRTPIYGDLIRRQGDWSELNSLVKKLNALYANGHYEAIQKKVPEISHLLETLAARIDTGSADPAQFQVSSIVVDQLAKVTYQVAQAVEFYGTLRYRTEEFFKTVDDNVRLVKDSI